MNIPDNNALFCNLKSGICEILSFQPEGKTVIGHAGLKTIRIIYFTDPICSSCWGIEPALRKLKLSYGDQLEIDYRMGGLLPDWNYNSGGISKPSDVAHHWDEVSLQYDMPIDGDVWLEDPLHSSFPPSIAFKAAQLQDREKAVHFLRALRELLFLQKKNITKWDYISEAAELAGLDSNRLQAEYDGRANDLFRVDLGLARNMGVRGFPTLFFTDSKGCQEKVYGSKPYSVYESALVKLYPEAGRYDYQTHWESLFSSFPTLTAREYAELSGNPRKEAEQILDNLFDNGCVGKIRSKNGSLWCRKV